jgi:LysR family glycine cleavage system transcriptional activator
MVVSSENGPMSKFTVTRELAQTNSIIYRIRISNMTTLPSITALRCFDASARLGSFTKAAEEVHLTQGAVSHQMLALEAQVGCPLFERKRAGLELTQAGRAYWVEIATALRQIERATQSIVMSKGAGGPLNLCVASSFATYWLIPRLSEFVGQHPEVTLNLSTHIGPVDFLSSAHDAAIEYCDGKETGLRAELVLPLILQPYASPRLLDGVNDDQPRAKVSSQDLVRILNNKPLIRHTTVPFAWQSWLANSGLVAEVSPQQLASGPQYALLSMALNGAIAGLGIALLPEYVARVALANRQLLRLSGVSFKSSKGYYLRYPENKQGLVALKSFQAWLASCRT